MSQSTFVTGGGSSIRRLEDVKTPEELEQRRIGEKLLWESAKDPIEGESDETKEERMQRAKEVMSSTDAIDSDISVGELTKVNEDIIIERTSEGFITYFVTQ